VVTSTNDLWFDDRVAVITDAGRPWMAELFGTIMTGD
jgi:hypothetical protein